MYGVANRRPTAADLALGVALALAVFAETALWARADQLPARVVVSPPLLGLAGVLFAAAALRRAAPLLGPGLAATAVVWLGVVQPAQAAPFMFTAALGLTVLGYRAGAGADRLAPWGLAGIAAGGALWVIGQGSPEAALFPIVVVALFGLLPWLAGRYRRQQRALVQAGAERIAQLEREQQIIAEQARLRERAKIAEGMHDSLGHELSLLALQAGALELDPSLAAPQRAAAGKLRAAAGVATERLAEIIGVLRDGAGPAGLQAEEGLAALLGRARDAGMAVTFTRTGQPPAALGGIIYQVVREALTNAAKHAPGAAVTVTVVDDEDATAVTVSNPPPAAAGAPDSPGGRLGLHDLRERVRARGGELVATSTEAGFRLAVRLPHRPAADPPPATR